MEFSILGGGGAIVVYSGLFMGSRSYPFGLSGSWVLQGRRPVVCIT